MLGNIFFKRNKKVGITRFFLKQAVMIITIMSVIVTYFWIDSKYNSFKEELTRTQKAYIENQKALIKRRNTTGYRFYLFFNPKSRF